MRINEMKIKNLFLAIYDQLTRKGAWRNIFVTHNAFGIFSRYSHIARGKAVSLRCLTPRKLLQ